MKNKKVLTGICITWTVLSVTALLFWSFVTMSMVCSELIKTNNDPVVEQVVYTCPYYTIKVDKIIGDRAVFKVDFEDEEFFCRLETENYKVNDMPLSIWGEYNMSSENTTFEEELSSKSTSFDIVIEDEITVRFNAVKSQDGWKIGCWS